MSLTFIRIISSLQKSKRKRDVNASHFQPWYLNSGIDWGHRRLSNGFLALNYSVNLHISLSTFLNNQLTFKDRERVVTKVAEEVGDIFNARKFLCVFSFLLVSPRKKSQFLCRLFLENFLLPALKETFRLHSWLVLKHSNNFCFVWSSFVGRTFKGGTETARRFMFDFDCKTAERESFYDPLIHQPNIAQFLRFMFCATRQKRIQKAALMRLHCWAAWIVNNDQQQRACFVIFIYFQHFQRPSIFFHLFF